MRRNPSEPRITTGWRVKFGISNSAFLLKKRLNNQPKQRSPPNLDPNEPKKKSTGLSKKIPAIFEGIPDIETVAEQEAAASERKPVAPAAAVDAKAPEHPSAPAGKVLFEI